MRLALLLLAFAAPAGAAGAGKAPAAQSGRSPQDILLAMESLHASQQGLHPLDAQAVERKLRAAGEELRSMGARSVPILSYYVAAKERQLKVRLYAAALLGMIRDPAALKPLKARVSDPEEDPGLRSAALQSIWSLGLEPGLLRPILEEAVAPKNPEALIREGLLHLAWLGAGDVAAVELAAKRHGPGPAGAEELSAGHALAALSRSEAGDADAALWRLLGYFKKGTGLRGDVLSGITRRRLIARSRSERRAEPLKLEQMDSLTRALHEETGDSAVSAARILAGLGDRRATSELVRTLERSGEPQVIAEAAEAIAAIGDPAGAEGLRRLNERLNSDGRFRPRPGEPDPREFALRIQSAAEVFLRVTTAPPAAKPPPAPPPPAPKAPVEAPAKPPERAGTAGTPELEAPPLPAPSARGLYLAEVRITGASRVSERRIRRMISAKKNAPYPEADRSRDVSQLMRSGLFTSVMLREIVRDDSSYALEVVVAEGLPQPAPAPAAPKGAQGEPVVEHIQVTGARRVGVSRVLSMISARKGLPYPEDARSKDMANLLEWGMFSSVLLRKVELTDTTILVDIHVEERRVLPSARDATVALDAEPERRAPRPPVSQKPPAPFRYAGWPGAGRPRLVWNGAAKSLTLRYAPQSSSPAAASVALAAGEPLRFDDSFVVTVTPGRVRADRSHSFDARQLGRATELARKTYEGPAVSQELRFEEGDTLEVLSYRADGRCFVRLVDEVYEGPCPQNDRDNFSVLEDLAVEWWLHTDIGGSSGWFLAEQDGIDVLARE